MSLLPSGAIESAGYDINNSLRFRKSASAYLSRTIASPTNNKKWTYSCWVKRGELGSSQYTALLDAYLDGSNWSTLYFTSDQIWFYNILGGTDTSVDTVAVFRDPSAWYHVVFVFDSANATTADRGIIYVNGVRQTVNNTYGVITLNEATYINNSPSYVNKIGLRTDASLYMDGYLTEINFIDGQALTPSSFGETDTTTGVWKPKAYTGTYGTNGFYLKFSDIATTSGSNAGLGKDFSGNTNYWTTNNISVTSGVTYDAMKDSPTNTSATVANYCVLNPLDKNAGSVADGNLKFTDAGGDGWDNARGTMAVTSGKWYWEMTATNVVSSVLCASIASPKFPLGNLPGQNSVFGVTYYPNGNVYYNSSGPIGYGNSWTTGDVIGIALDMDNGKVWFSKNGTWQASGDPAAGTNAAYSSLLTHDSIWQPITGSYYSGSIATYNFGQRPFSYTPPTGYVALNTYNLPDSTIKKGSQYFNTVLYTGNGSTNAITGVGFSPDFVWVKNRAVAEHNCLYDSVRGVYKQLYSNLTNVEDNATNSLTSFDSDGFTLANNTTPNTNGNAHVSWNWRGSDSSAVSNTSGTITSTVSVNATAGFSVVTYTGTGANATVGHGLGVAPAMVIVKRRTGGTGNWNVRHVSITAANSLYLNLTNASQSDPTVWNSTVPTSTVFSIGTDTGVNASASTYVAYCWAEIAGFSRFGSYTGNGSADGPFIFTGFRPKFILTKKTNGAGDDWTLFDTARNTYNLATLLLRPNSSVAELSSSIDILSNGFKWRQGGGNGNETSGTYIYMAFAENPFKNALAR